MGWLTARAPARIDFTGAYTDILPFCETVVGHQVNLAVTLWATAAGALRDDGRIVIDLPDLAAHTDVATPDELRGSTPSALVERIVAELLDGHGLSLRVTTLAPAGSGLGGSGAVGVAVVGLIRALLGHSLDAVKIANDAAALERRAGSLGGRQDQFAAALGGLHHFQFLSDTATVDRLTLGPQVAETLRDRFVLVHPGGSRESSGLVDTVIGRHMAGDDATTRALTALNDAAHQVRTALDADDPSAFAASVRDVARLQRAVSPVIASPALTHLEAELSGVVEFVKPTGSGGAGNCLLVNHRSGQRSTLLGHLARRGFRVLPIEVDHQGLVIQPAHDRKRVER